MSTDYWLTTRFVIVFGTHYS